MRVVVTGAGGMVGRAVSRALQDHGDDVVAFDHGKLDISAADQTISALKGARPDVVINCAAWTDVDGCESDSARAYASNAAGPESLARASRLVGSGFLTISTDYVFDGLKDGFYTQRDDPNPLSVYALAKLEGERRAQAAYARTIVVRTGFIFGPSGKNFLSTVIERARRGESIKAISNAWGTPTYALHLAERLRELAELDLPGIFHVVNASNGVSYEEFAREVVAATNARAEVEAVTEESLHRPADRPRNARLRCLLSEAIGLSPLPPWREGLKHFIDLQA